MKRVSLFTLVLSILTLTSCSSSKDHSNDVSFGFDNQQNQVAPIVDTPPTNPDDSNNPSEPKEEMTAEIDLRFNVELKNAHAEVVEVSIEQEGYFTYENRPQLRIKIESCGKVTYSDYIELPESQFIELKSFGVKDTFNTKKCAIKITIDPDNNVVELDKSNNTVEL